MNSKRALCALGLLALFGWARAQTIAPGLDATVAPANAAPAAPAGPCCTLAGGSPVELELMEPVNSAIQKRGDRFGLRLASPVMVGTTVVLPAGLEGSGEIIDAAPSRAGGAPGKLLLAARSLTWNGTKIPLRGLRLGGAGRNLGAAAVGASLVAGPFAMFIHGGNVVLPAGTHAEAKIAVDTPVIPVQAGPFSGSAQSTAGTPTQAPPVTSLPDSQDPTHLE